MKANRMQKARRYFRIMEITMWTYTAIYAAAGILLLARSKFPLVAAFLVLPVCTGYTALSLTVMRKRKIRK